MDLSQQSVRDCPSTKTTCCLNECLRQRSYTLEFWCSSRCDPFPPILGQLAKLGHRKALDWDDTQTTYTELSMNAACAPLFLVCKTGQLHPGHGWYQQTAFISRPHLSVNRRRDNSASAMLLIIVILCTRNPLTLCGWLCQSHSFSQTL